MCYFGNLILNMQYCGIILQYSLAVCTLSLFWLMVFDKMRSFTVLRYRSFALMQVNALCKQNTVSYKGQ